MSYLYCVVDRIMAAFTAPNYISSLSREIVLIITLKRKVVFAARLNPN